MPDDDYRLYRAADTVLIRTASAEIELTAQAAARLAIELHREPVQPRPHGWWTQAKLDELRRLYVDENVTPREIARRFGVTPSAVSTRVSHLKLPSQSARRGNSLRALPEVRKAPQ